MADLNLTSGDFQEIGHVEIEENGTVWTVIIIVVCTGIPILTGLICGFLRLCNKEEDEPGYSVAISNRLFTEERFDGKSDLPCLNCRLIEMGSMACYQDKCPQCGRPPPTYTMEEP